MPELRLELDVLDRDGLHARPAAQLIEALADLDAQVMVKNLRTGKPAVALRGPTSVLMLGARFGDRLVITATGPDAERAIRVVEGVLVNHPGEGPGAGVQTELTNFGISPGIAVGPVLRMPEPLVEPPRRLTEDVEAEVLRLVAAAGEVAAQLGARGALVAGEARQILEASALMATDQTLVDDASALIRGGESAERAAWLATSAFAAVLSGQGGRGAERVADVHDVRNRVVAQLLGQPTPGVPESPRPFVLFARELAPFDVALLDPARCLAIVMQQGGPTSHAAIVARSLGIPAVVAPFAGSELSEGTVVYIDGSTGRLELNPSDELVEAARLQANVAEFGGFGATKDGHPVQLLANVDSADSVNEALKRGAQGVGLFRTELCFLDRVTAPSVEEQVAAYRPVFAAFAGRTVVVRTLDAGGDKPLAFVAGRGEPNPTLGTRGIRMARRQPELLDDQLAAIARAAEHEGADVRVMAPMITNVDEAADFVAACRAHGIAAAGAVVETPAAAVMATELCGIVDFVSIGTNDLTQYTMAADRELGELASLNDAWQPAVLRLMAMTVSSCEATGTPVGVCGEAAADPFLAAVFVGLGVSSLSMTPRAIGAVAAHLATVTLDDCRRAADAARDAPTAKAARLAALAIFAQLPVR